MDNQEHVSSSDALSEQEQLHSREQQNSLPEPEPEPEVYDYDREPPLDSATASSNRRRSKYVFMTLCFLLALILFYTYITKGDTSDWFPLVGAIVLGILGIIFWRSSDGTPATVLSEEKAGAGKHDESPEKKLSPFEELVQEALATIPEEFQTQMENLVVHVAPEPNEETRLRIGLKEGYTLLGLYEGVPLTTYGRAAAPYPEVITIYQNSIEAYCHHNPTRIREQVHATVLHEIAHHFGMGHEAMPIWIK